MENKSYEMRRGIVARTDKNTRMLSLYYRLLTGKPISKQAFCVEHNITARSFDRDIEDVRLFLSEEQSYCELQYDKQNNIYHLSNALGKSFPGEISLFIVDLLFSVKILSKDEMEGLLAELLGVTEMHKNNELYEYVMQKVDFKNNWGNRAILKMHRDLQHAIKEQCLIELNYEISEENNGLRKVYPVQLKVDNGFIYLIAYIVDKQYINPAFFRLDRIISFTILKEKFSKDIQNQYIEKTKQNDLYNMLAGDEITVTVRIHKDMKKILCDVFPNCALQKKDNDGYYIYKINTYKQGFISWILGQEKEVIILEPEDIKREVVLRLKAILKNMT